MFYVLCYTDKKLVRLLSVYLVLSFTVCRCTYKYLFERGTEQGILEQHFWNHEFSKQLCRYFSVIWYNAPHPLLIVFTYLSTFSSSKCWNHEFFSIWLCVWYDFPIKITIFCAKGLLSKNFMERSCNLFRLITHLFTGCVFANVIEIEEGCHARFAI